MNKIFVDFNNADSNGRIRLNTNGTLSDIEKYKIELLEGREILIFDDDEFEAIGVLKFSPEENIWLAELDWENLK